MPKHVISQHPNNKKQTRKNLDIYYDALLYAVKLVKYWPDDSLELQEFLDQGTPVPETDRPQEFEDFCEAFDTVYYAGLELGINEQLSTRKLRALARGLYQSRIRQKYYLRFLTEHRRCASEEVRAISPSELEERYLYYLYKRDCKHRRTDIDHVKSFENWRDAGDCITFYDILS